MIHRVHTSCKDCIFAEYADITQVGCRLNLIDRYKKYDVEILETYDEEKEFFVINKTKCMHKRPDAWKHSKLPIDEQILKVNEETTLHFHALIFLNDSNLTDIKVTIDSLVSQKVKPKHITCVKEITKSKIDAKEVIELLNTVNIPWRIENVIEDRTQEDIIDLIVPFIKAPVYIVFQSGFVVPENTLYDISEEVMNNFKKFMVLLPNSSNNGLSSIKYVHEHYQGNHGKTLIEKLKDDECPQEYLIPICQMLSYFPK